MNARRIAILLAVGLSLPVLGAGVATARSDAKDTLKSVRAATDHLRNTAAAEAAGYRLRLPDLTGNTCITEPGQGTMGVHLVNTNLLDATLHPSAPEALVYQPRADGSLKLVAVEYVVFQEAWDKAKGAAEGQHASAPRMFGRQFDFTASPNRYGLPPFYALHAWAWTANPRGMFFAWNPKVKC
jgi:hypothetical protein